MHEILPPTQPPRPRAVYPVAEAARVTGGRIVRIHHNACPALAEQPSVCTCVLAWRLISERKGGRAK
jgi:hypothetical protein